ncbi:hypothetical protein EXS62_01505 [Candidatus Kaiserbacteria bacterium]|nr:hypothetical protein [Candidatus Kaiserbacteria bacterium]
MFFPISVPPSIPQVPFYSQFHDISYTAWQKSACGVASLAMVIDFYKTEPVSVDTVLGQATSSGAYLKNAGWTYKGLIGVAKKYGLEGSSYDLAQSTTEVAFARFTDYLKDGPVIVSVHYKFDPKSTIPHLVVIDGVQGGVVYYNDPAAKTGQKQISVTDFQKAWKKRFIVIRPPKEAATVAVVKK